MTTPKRAPARRPLSCHLCNAGVDRLTVGRGQHRRKVDGVERIFVDVTCQSCGAEWPSVHADAIAISRQHDAEAEAGPGAVVAPTEG